MRVFKGFIVLISFFSYSCQDNKTSSKKNISDEEKVENHIVIQPQKKRIPRITNATVGEFYTEYGKQNPEKKIRVKTKFGDIDIDLFEDTPMHRANFIHIVKRGFLNETCFYRVAKDFVVQGGNSDSFKMAKIKNKIGQFTLPSEFLEHRKHTYGAVAMARIWKNNPSRRSSPFEFYIVMNTQNAKHLNGEHTIIGRVIKGMDVAKKINLVKVDKSEWPINDICMDVEILD